MACAYAPWAHLVGKRDELRRLVGETIEVVKGRWSVVIGVLPLIRTLYAAEEGDLLDRLTSSMAAEAAHGARLATSHRAARGLIALREGDAPTAVELLERTVEAERALGYDFDAAALELDLADALDAAGETARAAELRGRAESYLASLGCVHPL